MDQIIIIAYHAILLIGIYITMYAVINIGKFKKFILQYFYF